MATLSLAIPVTDDSFYDNRQRVQVEDKLSQITSRFGDSIKEVSRLTNVNEKLLTGFVFIESAGNSDVVSPSGAVGLMQIKPDTVADVLFLERKQKRLNAEERKALESYIGKAGIERIFSMRWMGDKGRLKTNPVTSKMLRIPRFNLLVGAIFLGILLDQETEKGDIRIDRVVLRYNRGYFAKIKKGSVSQVLASLKSNREAYNYILKLAGRNGTLDILTT